MRKRTHPPIPEAVQVIHAFGGPSNLARICGVTPASVSEWGRYGIPQAREQYLRLLNPAAFNVKRPH